MKELSYFFQSCQSIGGDQHSAVILLDPFFSKQAVKMSIEYPKGLSNKECERGSGSDPVPIRYVPDVDPIQEVLEVKPCPSFKITFPKGGETKLSVWDGRGNDEQFLLHVNKAEVAIGKLGAFADYEKHSKLQRVAQKKLVTAEEQVAAAKKILRNAKGKS